MPGTFIGIKNIVVLVICNASHSFVQTSAFALSMRVILRVKETAMSAIYMLSNP